MAVFACLGVAAVATAAYFAAEALVAPIQRTVGAAPADLPIESIGFDSQSGARIAGWLVKTPGAGATVILLHPLRADRRAMLGRARLLHAEGYRVLLVDLQGHGESRGEAITMGWLERHDALAAVEYARQRWPTDRVGVVGWSLGGAAALLASPLGVDSLVLESVYPTLSEAVQNRIARRAGPLSRVLAPMLLCQVPMRLGVGLDSLRPIDGMAPVGCPVLLLAGDRDRRTPPHESRRLADAGRERSELVFFQGAGHTDLLEWDRQRWIDAVLPHLERGLGGPGKEGAKGGSL